MATWTGFPTAKCASEAPFVFSACFRVSEGTGFRSETRKPAAVAVAWRRNAFPLRRCGLLCRREGRDCGRYAPTALSLPRSGVPPVRGPSRSRCHGLLRRPQSLPSRLQPVPPLSSTSRAPERLFSCPDRQNRASGHQTAPNRVRSGEIGGPGTGMAFFVSGECHSERPVILSEAKNLYLQVDSSAGNPASE